MISTRYDRIIAWLAAATVVAILFLAGVVMWATRDNAATSADAKAAAVATDVQNCRAAAGIPYERAARVAEDAQAQVQFTTNEGLQASAQGDLPRLALVASRAQVEREAAIEAEHRASQAGDEYDAKLNMAIVDQAGFLAACHAEAGQ